MCTEDTEGEVYTQPDDSNIAENDADSDHGTGLSSCLGGRESHIDTGNILGHRLRSRKT